MVPERKAGTVVVRGGTIVDASGKKRGDVVIEGDRIVSVSSGGETSEAPRSSKVLDAGGCLVAPGLVDLHTHMREPGGEESETIETAARAAALGGYTAVVAMPNTEPAVDTAAVAREVLELGAQVACRVCVAGAITVGRRGEQLAPMAELAALGVRIFTDDGAGVQDSGVMRRAMDYARGLGVTIAEHCEDSGLAAGGHMHEGAWSSRLGVPGIPAEAEEVMARRDIALARLTGARLHLLHVSTAATVQAAEAAKAEGVAVTVEVAPHHLALTDAMLGGYDAVFKVNPPLRPDSDVQALRDACASGVVDAIATDHAPHPAEAKDLPLAEAPPGMLGLETALAVSIASLDRLDIADVIALMSWRPARVAGISVEQGGDQGGLVSRGMPANVCVIDPAHVWTVDGSALASRSSNTPYQGRKLTGKVRHTIFRGEPVVVDEEAQR